MSATARDRHYSFIEVHNRVDPLSSIASHVPSLWETRDVQSYILPEDVIRSPLEGYTASSLINPPVDEVVESNYDPSIHIDKFWLESNPQNQYIEEPLVREEVVERFIGRAHIFVESSITNTDAASHVSEHNTAGSPTESQCSSIDPRLHQLQSIRDVDIVKESQISIFPGRQYFPYDNMTLASPPHEYRYDEYHSTDLQADDFQFPRWDGCVERGSSQFFNQLLFRQED